MTSVFDSGVRNSWKSPPSSRAGAKAAAQLDVLQPLRRSGGQERDLHPLREADFLLEPLLVGADLFVQPRVLDRDGGLAGQQRQDLDVALAERIELRTLEIDDPDAAVLEEHRDGQLGPDVRHQFDVARILGYVGHQHRFLVQCGVADQSLAEPHPGHGDLLAVLHGELHLQLA